MIPRICIVGAGAIAREHAKAALALPHPPLIAAADPSASARDSFQEAFPQASLFSTIEEMFAPHPLRDEVAIVATPPWLHASAATRSLLSGRHVLCEKPLVLSLQEAEELVALAERQDRVIACCSSRFSSRALTDRVRETLSSGAIGDRWRVRWISRAAASRPGIEYQPASRWFLDRSRAGGGSLLDWGCYDVALWIALFRPASIKIDSAWFGYPRRGPSLPPGVVCDVEHQAVACLRIKLADGREIPVQFERSSASFGRVADVFEIEGDLGALDWDWLDWQGHDLRLHRASPDGAAVTETRSFIDDEPGFHARPLHALAAQLEGRPHAGLSGRRALQAFAVIDAIRQTAGDGVSREIHLSP